MATLRANGIEVARLERTYRKDGKLVDGAVYRTVTYSARNNGKLLRKVTSEYEDGTRVRGRWKVMGTVRAGDITLKAKLRSWIESMQRDASYQVLRYNPGFFDEDYEAQDY